MACGYVRPAELFYFVSRGLAMVGVMQINHIQIHGQPVTENSVESDQYSLVRALFSCSQLSTLALCKKKILSYIKLVVHAWSTKCRRNQKLIAQLGCTLRDERFEPN